MNYQRSNGRRETFARRCGEASQTKVLLHAADKSHKTLTRQKADHLLKTFCSTMTAIA
jgi:hypothetical protein